MGKLAYPITYPSTIVQSYSYSSTIILEFQYILFTLYSYRLQSICIWKIQNCEIRIQHIWYVTTSSAGFIKIVYFLDQHRRQRDLQHLSIVFLFPYYFILNRTDKQTITHTHTHAQQSSFRNIDLHIENLYWVQYNLFMLGARDSEYPDPDPDPHIPRL